MDFTTNSLDGRHVVITGASTGIGRATGTRVAAAGGRVTLIARRSDLLDAARQELGEGAKWAAADVGDTEQLVRALDAAVHQNGPIDGLFLNEGHALDHVRGISSCAGDRMDRGAAQRDDVRVGDPQRHQYVAGQALGDSFDQPAERAKLDLGLAQRAIGEQPDPTAGSHVVLNSAERSFG